MTAAAAAVRWWTAPVPAARVAVLRAILYPFVIVDVLFLVNDVIPHGHSAGLYDPTLIGRVLPYPGPSVAYGWVLLTTIVVGSVVAATGRLPRLAGWVVAVAFLGWMINTQGFGYVQHDHLALTAAMLVLPTVGRARFTDTHLTEAGGWALRVVQVCTVATYIGSALMKWLRNGGAWVWANSAVFTWAITRRGTFLVSWTVNYPWLLKIAQWGLYVAEVASPVVFWLKGRWLAAAICFYLVFHLMTYLAIGIHFLPTVVCWASFAPLERLVPPAQRAWARVTRRDAGAVATA